MDVSKQIRIYYLWQSCDMVGWAPENALYDSQALLSLAGMDPPRMSSSDGMTPLNVWVRLPHEGADREDIP
jgi:hypothetical protein